MKDCDSINWLITLTKTNPWYTLDCTTVHSVDCCIVYVRYTLYEYMDLIKYRTNLFECLELVVHCRITTLEKINYVSSKQ